MGGSSDSESTSTIRYAPYVENHHQNFLTINHEYLDQMRNDGYNPYSTIFQESQAAIDAKPPADVDFEIMFYGAGYTASSFPSLYDMYGKFLAGLDVEVLWEQSLSNTQDNAAVSALTHAHADLLDEELTDDILPRLRAGLRDINAITSSSYWIAVSNLEAKKAHDVAKFDAELRYKLIPVAADRWAKHLVWNKDVIMIYQDIIKQAVLTTMDQDNFNYNNRHTYVMWPWILLEQYRANLGALQGATTASAAGGGGSSALGGALGGAALGASVTGGNPIGAAIGGAIGLATSFF